VPACGRQAKLEGNSNFILLFKMPPPSLLSPKGRGEVRGKRGIS